MSKRPIKWHQVNLKTRSLYLEVQRANLKRIQAEFKRSELEIDFLTLQIETAIKEKKDGFDSDKFLKKHKPQIN